MSDTELIIAVVVGLWLMILSANVRYLYLRKVDWEDHERYASLVREMRANMMWVPKCVKRTRFWKNALNERTGKGRCVDGGPERSRWDQWPHGDISWRNR